MGPTQIDTYDFSELQRPAHAGFIGDESGT